MLTLPNAPVWADTEEKPRFEFPLTAESCVIDAGAFTGEWSHEIARRYGCHIEAFEPIRKYAAMYKLRMAGASYRLAVACLGDEDMQVEMAMDGEASSSVIARKDAELLPVEMVCAARYFDERGIDNIDLMKVNIEGGEFDLIRHLIDSGWIEKIRRLLIQWHRAAPDAEKRYEVLRDELGRTHRLLWDYPWVWQSWERP